MAFGVTVLAGFTAFLAVFPMSFRHFTDSYLSWLRIYCEVQKVQSSFMHIGELQEFGYPAVLRTVPGQ